MSSAASRSGASDLGELSAEHRGDDLELVANVFGVGLGEDRADRGGDHLG
jgi:hypothetical protein